jgi:hypothetical protein
MQNASIRDSALNEFVASAFTFTPQYADFEQSAEYCKSYDSVLVAS